SAAGPRMGGGSRRVVKAAINPSGFDAGHASRYYVRRRAKGQSKSEKPRQNTRYQRYAKLGMVIDVASHMILAAEAGNGPRPDIDRFVPLVDRTLGRVRVRRMLGDAGYDSEPIHRHAR